MADFTFHVGNLIQDGEYWEARRDTGGVIHALCSGPDFTWGNFAIVWKFNDDDPGFPIFNVNVHTYGPHFVTLEENGLTLYEGDPVRPGKILWRADCPDAERGVLRDNGQISLYDKSGTLRWQSAQNLTADGVRTIYSFAPPILMLSGQPPSDPGFPWVSVQTFDDDDPRNRWEMINLHTDGNTYGILRNVAADMILDVQPAQGQLAQLTRSIRPDSLWYFLSGGHGPASYCVRTINCGLLVLNAAGDSPAPGGRVVLWKLPPGDVPTLNLVWGVSEQPVA